jgi:hypothetical protein
MTVAIADMRAEAAASFMNSRRCIAKAPDETSVPRRLTAAAGSAFIFDSRRAPGPNTSMEPSGILRRARSIRRRFGAFPMGIDQLASGGMRLLSFSFEAQCTPSRSALMIGRFSNRSGTLALRRASAR